MPLLHVSLVMAEDVLAMVDPQPPRPSEFSTVEVVAAEEALGELVSLLPRALPPVVAGGIKRDLGALRQVAVGSEKGPLSKPSSEPCPKVEELYCPPRLTICLCK